MEIKKPKNKSRSISARTPKLVKKTISPVEPLIIETIEKMEAVIQNSNEDMFVEKNEVLFIEKTEEQNELLDVPTDIQKKLSKFDIKNTLNDKKKLFLTFIPWILLVIFLVSSFYLWSKLSDIKKDPLKAALAETNEVITSVGKIIVLPVGETPKIATLTDADLSKVKTQSFFINAEVGDKVIVYSLARKVILYDPNINKIVEVANLNSDNSPGSSPSL
jgi:hypothetical protein